MLIQVPVYSSRPFSFQRLSALLGVDDLVLVSSPNETPDAWFFYRRKHAVTMFMIEKTEDAYVLSMDRLASYDDYRFLPYLVDTLTFLLTDNSYRSDNGEDAFSVFNEEWAAEAMGEEVAFLKCFLSLGMKYYVALPISEANVYVCNEALNAVGVSMYSSTPRIFGYVSYLLRHHLLPADAVVSPAMMDEEVQVDVPQHHSLATVRSWQTDGAETTESYCKEDVELLLQLSRKYKAGEPVEGVVLNDIGTIFNTASVWSKTWKRPSIGLRRPVATATCCMPPPISVTSTERGGGQLDRICVSPSRPTAARKTLMRGIALVRATRRDGMAKKTWKRQWHFIVRLPMRGTTSRSKDSEKSRPTESMTI